MTDYTDLCARLREMYIRDGTDYVQRAADVIDRLQHTVEAMSADLDQNRVLFETLTEQNKSLFDAALLAAQERDAAMADAQRFVWWVGPKAAVSLREYTDGVVKRWTVDQWREWTDKAMKESGND